MSKSTSSSGHPSVLETSAKTAGYPSSQGMRIQTKGIYAALASAIFMGMTPVFGKQAIISGASPLAVVALRTLLAALLLFCAILLYNHRYLYIYPAGLLGCLLAGWTNGVGSLFYYSALARVDASVGHLLYSLYPFFLLLWLSLDRQPIGRLTLLRLVLVIPAVYLLTQARGGQVDLIGTGQMLIAAALYALHIPINQRVLYEMPAPTVTVYTLLSMGTVVGPVYLLSGVDNLPGGYSFWGPILGLTLVTFLSRLTLFMGVKHIGGMQTALLGVSELLVAVFLSFQWLGERFSSTQWMGAILLAVSLLLVIFEKPSPQKFQQTGWLSWIRAHNLPSEGP